MENLVSLINEMVAGKERIVVAMSGGVDSALVAAALHRSAGSRAMAVTIESELTATHDGDRARLVAGNIGIKHYVLPVDVLGVAGVRENGADRCYHCKKSIFSRIIEEFGPDMVMDGTNADDDTARPGLRAVAELGVVSPLKVAAMTKDMIRDAAREIGLPNWNTPSESCLAARIKRGVSLTKSGLSKVQVMESFFHERGVPALRIHHDNLVANVEYYAQYAEIMELNRDNFAALVEKIGLLSFEYKELSI